MVISRASRQIGTDDDETYELIGREIAKLVAERELEAVGEITRWMYSEVRLAPA